MSENEITNVSRCRSWLFWQPPITDSFVVWTTALCMPGTLQKTDKWKPLLSVRFICTTFNPSTQMKLNSCSFNSGEKINILRPIQTGRHFADDIFKCISLNDSLQILNKLCSLWPHWHYGSFGSDKGLSPVHRQTIIWSNVGMLYCRIFASFDLNALPTFAKRVFKNNLN